MRPPKYAEGERVFASIMDLSGRFSRSYFGVIVTLHPWCVVRTGKIVGWSLTLRTIDRDVLVDETDIKWSAA